MDWKARREQTDRLAAQHNTDTLRDRIIDAITEHIEQRPGMDPGNYAPDWAAYRREAREITRDLHDARALLREVRIGTTPAEIIEAARRAYSGRLSIELEPVQYTAADCPGRPCSSDCSHQGTPRVVLDYIPGQYWPTEYRAAACAVLASVLWYRWVDGTPGSAKRAYQTARRSFGRGVAGRWFA